MKICSLCSGSKGNSTFMEINGINILFDTGKNYKYIEKALDKVNACVAIIDYVFITHNHKDHVSALKDILKKSDAKLCINQKTFYELEDLKDFNRLLIFDDEIDICGITVKSIKSSHDATDGRNFVISVAGKKVSLITDTGYIRRKDFKYFENSDVFLIESNHDVELLNSGPYPEFLKKRVISDEGHLSNNQAGFYLAKLIGPKTKKVLLIHLSETNNMEDFALETVDRILDEYNVKFDNISCALQDEISEVIRID